MKLSAYPKLPHDQAIKHVINDLKGTSMQGLITKLDPETGIKWYVDAELMGGWNQEESKDPGSVPPRMGYVITYDNCLIIWASRIQA